MSSVMLSTDVLDEFDAADVRGPMSVRRVVPTGLRTAVAASMRGMGAGLKGAARLMLPLRAPAAAAGHARQADQRHAAAAGAATAAAGAATVTVAAAATSAVAAAAAATVSATATATAADLATATQGARRWPFSAVPASPGAPLDVPHDLPDPAPTQAAHVPGASMAGVSSAAFAAMLASDAGLRQQWRRRQVLDVALVLAWGVMIPAVMWVGAAVGF
ncbi:hypothetical protein [Bordetella genomosp. 5]|uniref:Uncharacterized protein n=1 Tax=Bordetella genomosp. 5 TaxID=1395608 RepID=A0A261THR3_9BORD|nr:hypothetical protein [Bordetella genomosp. 5]OZI49174.1 hypothetical protein CAL25_14120 [Bordetella genomosp. 5]